MAYRIARLVSPRSVAHCVIGFTYLTRFDSQGLRSPGKVNLPYGRTAPMCATEPTLHMGAMHPESET
jgi:hypothetical protein